MAASQNFIHKDIRKIAGDKNAIYIGEKTLSYLCLDKLQKNASLAVGTVLKLHQHDPFGIEILSFVTSDRTNPDISEIRTRLINKSNKFSLEVRGGLRVEVSLGRVIVSQESGTNREYYEVTDVLSHLELDILDISFELDILDDKIVVLPGDIHFDPKIIRKVFDDELNNLLVRYSDNSGRRIDLEYLNRIEGAMAYSAAQTMIKNLISDRHEISYSGLFPTTKFSGPMEAYIGGRTHASQEDLSSKNTLILVPKKVILGEDVCMCGDLGTGIGDPIPPTRSAGSNTGSINIGGISPVDVSTIDIGHRAKGAGEFGIYFPQSQVESFGPKIFPSIRITDHDNGFIGWRYKANVVFTDFNVQLDDSVGGIRITIDLSIDGSGTIDMEAGPYDRIKIAGVTFDQKKPSQVKILYVPAIKDGKVILKPILEKCEFPYFDVNVDINVLLGSPWGKAGQVVIFILNKFIAGSLEVTLPQTLQHELKDTMKKYAWTLLDVGDWTKLVHWDANPKNGNSLYTYHSTDKGSLLISTSSGE